MRLFILLALAYVPVLLHAQAKAFQVNGQSSYYNGKRLGAVVGIYPVSNPYNAYTLDNAKKDSVANPFFDVVDGRFAISGTLQYPHPLSVIYYDEASNRVTMSYYCFLDGGDANIFVADLKKDRNIGKAVLTAADREYAHLKRFCGNSVDTITGAIIDMQAKQQRMKAYISAHPYSYVALWELVFDFSQATDDAGKRAIRANTALFAVPLRQTPTCRTLRADLDKDLTLIVGQAYPQVKLLPALSLSTLAKGQRYVLIDFWYAHCKPCIAQLPALKALYDRFHANGFEIAGLSVDAAKDKGDWEATLRKYGMNWPQYRDVNGVEAERLGVRSFPSNFLLDENGVILRKDITLEELAVFLGQQLER
ncbi:MAG: TlpA family protein disulfide reductase [Sphingobacteriales bacterium]|nr:MAG: TlpA family protein disulfide reductase [Sphingobacteriales bacterium]